MADTYRVSLLGFWCHTESRDDMLEFDGKRDEVYIQWEVRAYERANPDVALLNTISEGAIMGDTWRMPNRVKAGSASKLYGGILTGDRFPTNEPWKQSGPLRKDYPPMKLWEGEVRNDRVIFVTPTIWEWDGGSNTAEAFLNWAVQNDTQHAGKAKEIFGSLPLAGMIIDGVSLAVQTVGTLTGRWAPLGSASDRPIGVKRDPNDPKGAIFNPQTVIMTPSHAAFYAQHDTGRDPGVLSFTYQDDSWLAGNYELFLKVEKVGGAPVAAPVPAQDGWLWCSACQGMFYGPMQDASVCPEGGKHTPQDVSHSGNYSVPHRAPSSADRQDGWSWCNKCQGLFWGRGWAQSRCPAGDMHTDPAVSGSGPYSLWHNAPTDPSRQEDWRWCSTCMGLFFNGNGAQQAESACPAGGPHTPVTQSRSGNYGVLLA